jgi:hypothetical protein
MGNDGARRYWYGVVAALADLEVTLILLVDRYQHVTIVIDPNPSVTAGVVQEGESRVLHMPEADILAIHTVGLNLPIGNHESTFTRETARDMPGMRFQLTRRGKTVASFIKD